MNKFLQVGWMGFFLFAVSASAAHFGLFVGVNEYAYLPSGNWLNYCVLDAGSMRTNLINQTDLTISGQSPVELRALAADLRARADHAEEQAEADGFTLAVAEFSPYGRRAL